MILCTRLMYLGGRRGGVIRSVGVLDVCAINCLFPCMGGFLLAQGWRMLEFVQGLSEVAGHQNFARTEAVVPCDGEAVV